MRIVLIIAILLCALYVEAGKHGRFVRRAERNHRYLENRNTSESGGQGHPRRVSAHRIGNRHPKFVSTDVATSSNGSQASTDGASGRLYASARSLRKDRRMRSNSTRSNTNSPKNRKDRHRPDKYYPTMLKDGQVKGNLQRQRLSRNYRRRIHYSANSTSANEVEILCANVTCSRKQECIVNSSNNEPVCVPKFSRHIKPMRRPNGNKKQAHSRRERLKLHKKVKLAAKENSTKIETSEVKLKAKHDAKRRAQEMKDQAKSFERRYEKFQDDKKTRLIQGNNTSSLNSSVVQAKSKPRLDGAKGLDSDKLPPCLAALKAVPHLLVAGAPILPAGTDIPECDSEGYYQPVQCSRGTGECWCTDRYGNEISGTRLTGAPNCKGSLNSSEPGLQKASTGGRGKPLLFWNSKDLLVYNTEVAALTTCY